MRPRQRGKADDNASNVAEVNTERPISQKEREVWRVRRGDRAWHVSRESPGTRETRSAPAAMPVGQTRTNEGDQGRRGSRTYQYYSEDGRAGHVGKGYAPTRNMHKENGSASVFNSAQKRPTSSVVEKDRMEDDANLTTCNSKCSSTQ